MEVGDRQYFWWSGSKYLEVKVPGNQHGGKLYELPAQAVTAEVVRVDKRPSGSLSGSSKCFSPNNERSILDCAVHRGGLNHLLSPVTCVEHRGS